MPHGVIGNTTAFDVVVPGSSPGGVANKCSSSSVGSERLATNEEVAGCLSASSIATRQSSSKLDFALAAPSVRVLP